MFISQRLKKQYTSAVTGKIDPDKRVTFEDRKEYEPSEDVIYNAHGKREVKAKVEIFIQRLTRIFTWNAPYESWKTKT